MKIIKTEFDGLVIIETSAMEDSRGYFVETYKEDFLRENNLPYRFVQDNESLSKYGVIRGLHYQTGEWEQTKLVRVTLGLVLDVALDIRKDSPRYGQYFSILLSSKNKRQLLIPKGFAHGYAVLSDTAIFSYKCDQYYAPEFEAGFNIKDPALKIDWQIPTEEMIISEKDRLWPNFSEQDALQ